MYVLQCVLRIHNPPNHVVYLPFYCITLLLRYENLSGFFNFVLHLLFFNKYIDKGIHQKDKNQVHKIINKKTRFLYYKNMANFIQHKPCTSEGKYLGSKSLDFDELYLPILYKMVIYFANIHLDRYIGSCSQWFVYCLVGFVNKIYQYHASLSVQT